MRMSWIVEVASTSETSVNFYQTTWCNIPEDGHLRAYFLGGRPDVSGKTECRLSLYFMMKMWQLLTLEIN
jgi:hypothetical protein